MLHKHPPLVEKARIYMIPTNRVGLIMGAVWVAVFFINAVSFIVMCDTVYAPCQLHGRGVLGKCSHWNRVDSLPLHERGVWGTT